MAIYDFLDKFLKNNFSKPKEFTQGDLISEYKAKFPQAANLEDSYIATEIASNAPSFAYLKNYSPDSPIDHKSVPRELRGEIYNNKFEDSKLKTAQDTISKIKSDYPEVKEADDIELAKYLETHYPTRFKDLSKPLIDGNRQKTIGSTISTMFKTPVEAMSSVVDPITKTNKTVVDAVDSIPVREQFARVKGSAEAAENRLLRYLSDFPDQGIVGLGADIGTSTILTLNGIYKGVTGDEFNIEPATIEALKNRDVDPKIASYAGQIVGGLSLLAGSSALIRSGRIAESVGAMLGRNQSVARFLAPIAADSATFASAGAIQEGIKQSIDGKLDPEKLGKVIASNTLTGAVFGGISGFSNGLYRVIGNSALGIGLTKAEGGSDTEAVINGVVFGAFTAFSAPELTRQQQIGAYKSGRKIVGDVTRETAINRGYSAGEAEMAVKEVQAGFDFLMKKAGESGKISTPNIEKAAKELSSKINERLIPKEKTGIAETEAKPFNETVQEMGKTPKQYKAESKTTNDLTPMPEKYKDSIEVKKSDIEGKGAFSTEEVRSGDTVGPAIIEGQRTPLGQYVNHSEKPNTIPEVVDGAVNLNATKPIKNGEEITVDYKSATEKGLQSIENKLQSIKNKLPDLKTRQKNLDEIIESPSMGYLNENTNYNELKNKLGDFSVVVKDTNGARAIMSISDFEFLEKDESFSSRIRAVFLNGQSLKVPESPIIPQDFMPTIFKHSNFVAYAEARNRETTKNELMDNRSLVKEIKDIKLSAQTNVPDQQKAKFVDMIVDPRVQKLLNENGVKEINIMPPFKFSLSEQAHYVNGKKIININADAENPTDSILHELGHVAYERMPDTEKKRLVELAKKSKNPIVKGYLKNKLYEEVVAELYYKTDELISGDSKIQKIVKSAEENLSKKLPDKILPVGLSVEMQKDPQNQRSDGKFEFQDKEFESRYQSSKGLRGPKIWELAKEFATRLKNSATRTYAEIPRDAYHAEFTDILEKQKLNSTVAKENSLRLIQDITLGLDKTQFDLFTRKVLLDDLSYDAQTGKDLPLGLTPEILGAEKARIDSTIEKTPNVKEAISKRKKIQESIKNELVNNKIITEEQAKNPNYFHHQVLYYAQAKNYVGIGNKLKKQKPGIAKKRMGTTLDINTDYLEAEFEYMTQSIQAIRTAENLMRLENSKYNIKDKLLNEAKTESEMLGRDVDWRELVPDGYTIWQPQKGNIFYRSPAIPESALQKLIEGVMPEDLLREFLFVGGPRKEFVLPDNIAKTLEELNKPTAKTSAETVFDIFTKLPLNLWKRWVLFNPSRLSKYMFQNALGDLDIVLTANPRAVNKFIQAFGELWDHFYSDKPMTKDMRDFFERGGLSSSITVNELPELKDTSLFKKFYDRMSFAQRANLVKRWFQAAGKFATFRENWFRYAMYLDYLERYKKGDFNKNFVLEYGASDQNVIDSMTDPRDKAAKVTTEAVGDYSNISEMGRALRNRLIPFYSWLEINFARYPKMFANAINQGVNKSVKRRMVFGTSVRVVGSLLTWIARAVSLWGAYQLWNNLSDPEGERSLSEYNRKHMHLLVGRDKHGNPMILRGQGALGDFLEWFGMNDLPGLARLYMDDKIDMPYLISELAKAPINKGFQAISPMYKATAEYLTGVSFFPDVTNPRSVRDRGRQLLQNIQMEDVYDWLKSRPQRSFLEIVRKSTPLVVSEVKENAYNDIRDLKYLYLERKGKGNFSGAVYTPRSEAAYYYRLAIKYGDDRAKKKFFGVMRAYGVTNSEYKNILKRLDPLSGLTQEEKVEFISALNFDERKKLEKAELHYSDLIGSVK